MKRNLLVAATAFFGLSVTAQLSGTYTIGGNTPDYSNIQDALTDLNSNGVNGPTIFNIRSGTYNEELTLKTITGTSSTNNVTFQSESNDSSSVVISYATTSYADQEVISLDSVSYVNFKKLSFNQTGSTYSSASIIHFVNECYNIAIENCNITGIHNSIYSSSGAYHENITIKNCLFTGGFHAINFRNDGGSKSEGSGVHIQNNNFVDQVTRSISLIGHKDFIISNNTISNPAELNDYLEGIYLGNIEDNGAVYNNVITISGKVGIGLSNFDNTSSTRAKIYNNSVYLKGDAPGGSPLLIGSTTSGSKVSYCDVYNNTFRSDHTNTGYGLKISYAENCRILNNIFDINLGFPVFKSQTTGQINEFDYNAFYSGDAAGYRWEASEYATFSSYVSGTSMNNNSIEDQITFTNATDYKTCDGLVATMGTNTLYSQTDIDGDARNSSTPSIGADECDLVTGISDHTELINVKVYPNPFNETITIAGLKNNSSIFVFDIAGRMVMQTSTMKKTLQLNLPNLESGNYFVKVISGNSDYVTKIVK